MEYSDSALTKFAEESNGALVVNRIAHNKKPTEENVLIVSVMHGNKIVLELALNNDSEVTKFSIFKIKHGQNQCSHIYHIDNYCTKALSYELEARGISFVEAITSFACDIEGGKLTTLNQKIHYDCIFEGVSGHNNCHTIVRGIRYNGDNNVLKIEYSYYKCPCTGSELKVCNHTCCINANGNNYSHIGEEHCDEFLEIANAGLERITSHLRKCTKKLREPDI